MIFSIFFSFEYKEATDHLARNVSKQEANTISFLKMYSF